MSASEQAQYDFLQLGLDLINQQELEKVKSQLIIDNPNLSGVALEDMAKNQMYLKQLNDKITTIQSDKNTALANLTNDINNILVQEEMNSNAVSSFGVFKDSQANLAEENKNKLNLLKESLYTLRKEALNANEEYNRYSSIVNFLKTIFITLLLITILYVVSRTGIIPDTIRNYIAIGIGVIGLMYILYSLWYNIGRDRVFYEMRNWQRSF